MKPFTHCIGCQSPLTPIKEQGDLVYQICSKQCKMQFAQYFAKSEPYDEISYFKFDGEKFFYYIYIRGFYTILANTIYVYSFSELKANGTANPFMKLPLQNFKSVDMSDPKQIEERIKTLITFS